MNKILVLYKAGQHKHISIIFFKAPNFTFIVERDIPYNGLKPLYLKISTIMYSNKYISQNFVRDLKIIRYKKLWISLFSSYELVFDSTVLLRHNGFVIRIWLKLNISFSEWVYNNYIFSLYNPFSGDNIDDNYFRIFL